jgi:uncharacterized protein (TIGR02757 family)
MKISQEIIDLLEIKSTYYNNNGFIESDPISVPHGFSKKEDIEISGFLTAVLSWGQRRTIIRNANQLMSLMGFEPYDFIMNSDEIDWKAFGDFRHRTFNGIDCQYFIKSIRNIYQYHGGLESAFGKAGDANVIHRIIGFRDAFFELPGQARTKKHLSNPATGASAKRINMYLRWMVRKDDRGVDFGIWHNISPSGLYCPLDVHSGNVARKLGLLERKQNDWKAVTELTAALRTIDPVDPVRFDFALFGLGAHEKF